jgi:hypothetical protein
MRKSMMNAVVLAMIWPMMNTNAALAQSDPVFAYWTRLYLQKSMGHNWAMHYEVDERRNWDGHGHLQFITHLHARRTWAQQRWALAPGTSFSYVNQVPEYRLFQEAMYWFPLGKHWKINQRLRLDERWFDQPNASTRFRFRVRYRLQGESRLGKSFMGKLAWEYMTHTDEFDQNRFYAALEWRKNKHLAVELGYMNLYRKINTNHISRLTAYWNI